MKEQEDIFQLDATTLRVAGVGLPTTSTLPVSRSVLI